MKWRRTIGGFKHWFEQTFDFKHKSTLLERKSIGIVWTKIHLSMTSQNSLFLKSIWLHIKWPDWSITTEYFFLTTSNRSKIYEINEQHIYSLRRCMGGFGCVYVCLHTIAILLAMHSILMYIDMYYWMR